MSVHISNSADADFRARIDALKRRLRGGRLTSAESGPVDVQAVVAEIIEDVAARGDEAVLAWEARLDNAELTAETLRVAPEQIDAARRQGDEEFLGLVRRVIANIREYQEHILLRSPAPLVRGGRELGLRYTPIERVGVYVPGGRAAYPSTVLMTVVPAQVAGVREIAMASPPTSDGDVNPMVLHLAGELGVGEVYRMGGAQAIAALACGTRTIPAVDKIVGPGNAFVAEAKRRVLGRVGIDSVAGPSEVLIIADETAPADWLAVDLLAQAEHDPGSAVLLTPSGELAQKVARALRTQAAALERADAVRASLEEYSEIVVVENLEEACELANEFAPEHLQIIAADEKAVLANVRNAGAIFLGPQTAVPLGDYYAGPSHVLPTGSTARFFGPLSCNDFLKASSTIRYDAASLAEDAADVADFAAREGLGAHAKAVKIRRKDK